MPDDIKPSGSHAANGSRSPLYKDDWSYIEPIPLEEMTAADFAQMDEQRAPFYADNQAGEIIRTMKASENDPTFGYQINNFRHCLQSATMAYRAGKDEEYVAIAVLHDIGFVMSPSTHGEFAATLMGPYISDENRWMLERHAIFQNIHCRDHPTIDRHGRDKWKGHPAFAQTAEFVALFDQAAMDPNYENMPFEAFEPMIYRLFAKPPKAISLP